MSIDVLSVELQSIRGKDSNSLLRMYDRAKEILAKSPSQMERTKADRALQRIGHELQKRHVKV